MDIFNLWIRTFVGIYFGWPLSTEACLQPCLEHYFRHWQEKKNSFGLQGHKNPWAIFYHEIKQFVFSSKLLWGAYGQKTTQPPKAFWQDKFIFLIPHTADPGNGGGGGTADFNKGTEKEVVQLREF